MKLRLIETGGKAEELRDKRSSIELDIKLRASSTEDFLKACVRAAGMLLMIGGVASLIGTGGRRMDGIAWALLGLSLVISGEWM
jgi:hypothetical protein